MSKRSTSLTDSRFGSRGWSIIIYAMILYFFYAALATDGQNLYPTVFESVKGWDANALLAYATPAGIIGIVGGFVFARMVIKVKAKVISGITLIITGIMFAVMGFAPSAILYFIAFAALCFVSSGFGLAAFPVFMANWFPRKKGIALGWATMGAPISTAAFVPMFSVMLGKFGIEKSFLIIGIVVIIIGCLTFVWAADSPYDVGALPDNMEEDENVHADEASTESIFTVKTLLSDKDMWLIIIGFGLLWMVTVGIMSQFIPRMMSVGYTQVYAMMMLTVAAIIAIPGSYLWGFLDTKLGTKKATIVYSASYVIALILMITSFNQVLVWIGCVFVGLGIGGLLNLMQSMVITVYGRRDFVFANSLVMPIASLFRVCSFALIAVLLGISGGSFTLPYIVFIVIDIIGAIMIMFVTNECKGRN